jgi:hypothetical protein
MNNDRYRWTEKKTHTEHLEHLLHRPKILGINDPVQWSAKEMLIYKPTYPELATDIDLIYATNKDIWVAEYKISPGHIKDAKRQLDIARDFVKEKLNTTARCLYVAGPKYDRFEVGKEI